LEVIQEAVDLRHQLATDRPGVFNSVFTSSLNKLSQQLTNLDHHEQALEALREAAMIHSQHAAV
jgi:hypothetical protein